MNEKRLWCGLAGLLACCAVGFSDVQYISESRSVQASGTLWPVVADMQSQNDLKQSNDLGAFDQTAKVQLLVNENIPSFFGNTIPNALSAYAMVSQNSSLTSDGVIESGTLDYYTCETYSGNEAASAASSLAVTFALDDVYTYSLFFTGGFPGETATLTDIATGQVWDDSTTPGGGVLMPGEYTLTHILDYGQAYHDSSLPVNFGLQLNLSDIGVDAATSSAVPEPDGGWLLAAGCAIMALGYRPRRAEFGIARCR